MEQDANTTSGHTFITKFSCAATDRSIAQRLCPRTETSGTQYQKQERSMRRVLTTALMSLALCAASPLAPAASAATTTAGAGASAAQTAVRGTAPQTQAVLTCPGYETSTYNPGLTLLPRQVALSASGAIGPCVGLPLDHTTGTVSFSGHGILSCVLEDAEGSGRIDWTNPRKSSSTFAFTTAISVRPGGVSAIVMTGEVASGDFTGSTVVVEFILSPGPTQPLDCLTEQGLTTVSGALSLEIL
nr:hypothetical protein StreXyl84_06130 [Streptomyces sp. Xyl84]